MERFKNFNSGYERRVVLDETNLNRLLSYHFKEGFIIISANRGENTNEQNKEAFKELKRDVGTAHLSYVPVFGGYIENKGKDNEREVEEPSLLITTVRADGSERTPFDELIRFGQHLCMKFDQESFLVKVPGDNNKAEYVDRDGKVVMTFNGKSLNDITKEYFTSLHKSKQREPRRFTLESISTYDKPSNFSEAVSMRYGEWFWDAKEK